MAIRCKNDLIVTVVEDNVKTAKYLRTDELYTPSSSNGFFQNERADLRFLSSTKNSAELLAQADTP